MIHVGLVGFGLSGRYLQAPFFETNPHFVLKKIVTSQPIPKQLFQNAEAAQSIDELINDASLDLISIATPSLTHFDYAKRAIEAGKHVLIEKPITATLEEAKTLYNLAEKHKKLLCVYQNRRFDSDFMTVANVIQQGFLGKIHTYEAHFHRYKPQLNPKKWKEVVAPANGILYDLGSHLIDQAIVLFGKPQKVEGEVFTQREGSEIDDSFFITLHYEGLKVRLSSSLLIKNPPPRYQVHGYFGTFTKAGIDVQEDHLRAGIWPSNPSYGFEPVTQKGVLVSNLNGLEFNGTLETYQGNWNLLYDNLANAILNGEQLFQAKEQILTQLEIIEKIKKN